MNTNQLCDKAIAVSVLVLNHRIWGQVIDVLAVLTSTESGRYLCILWQLKPHLRRCHVHE